MEKRRKIFDTYEKMPEPQGLSAAASACLMSRSSAAIAELLILSGPKASFSQFVREVLAPAARELGKAWVDDRLSFADVTIGCARLELAVEKFPHSPNFDLETNFHSPTVFLTALADTQHTLGATVAGRAFAEAGWNVARLDRPDLSEASLSYLRRNRADLIALAVGTTDRAEEVTFAMKRLRAAAPGARIFLTGPAVTNAPELFRSFGAEIVGGDLFDVAAQFKAVAAA